MFLNKLNKWILSLAILVGVVAFSGYSEIQVKSASNITVLVIDKPSSKSSIFYFSKIKYISNLTDYYQFSFQSLLKNHSLKTDLQLKTSNFNCLQYISTFRFQELINSLRQDDYYNIFIG